MKTREEIERNCRQALPVEYIETEDGVFGEFIEGWYAKKVANDVFGTTGWSSETVRMDGSGTDKYGNPIFVAKARVTVQFWAETPDPTDQSWVKETVVREGTGSGSGSGEDDYELAAKEAETDAIKRALSTFGAPFGLSLYQGEGKGQFEMVEADWFGPEQKTVLRNKVRELDIAPTKARHLFEEASEEGLSVEETIELFQDAAT